MANNIKNPVRKTFIAQMFGEGVKFKDLTTEQKREYHNARVQATSKRPHKRTGQAEDLDADIPPNETLQEEQTLVQEMFGYEAKVRTLNSEQNTEYLRVLDGRRAQHRMRARGEARNTCIERWYGKGATLATLTKEQKKDYDHMKYIRRQCRAQIIIPDDDILPTNFIDITNDTVRVPEPKKLKCISMSSQ